MELELENVVEKIEGELINTSDMLGMSLFDLMGEKCGEVVDLLLDDEEWTIRYFVASTGGLFNREKILVSPWQLRLPEPPSRSKGLYTKLTKEQVEASPPLDSNAPISRQYEQEMAEYHEYPKYWIGPALWGVFAIPRSQENDKWKRERHEQKLEEIRESHLRSVDVVTGYEAFAGVDDESVGTIDDFMFDSETWKIRYLVIKTGSLLSRKYIILNHEWASNISWELQQIKCDSLSLTVIDALPDFHE